MLHLKEMTSRSEEAVPGIVEKFRDLCVDWDGTELHDDAEARTYPTCGDLREAADHIERLTSALERLDRNFKILLSGKPVRDVAETDAEVREALSLIKKQGNGHG